MSATAVSFSRRRNRQLDRSIHIKVLALGRMAMPQPGWGRGRTLLRQSVPEWNALRQQYPDYLPLLSGVDLEGLDLSGADLHDADLRGAYLAGARFARAILAGADLRRANLRQADLTGTDLRGANLKGADLHGAELKRAKLKDAVLTDTILDPQYWATPLLELWQEARPERRRSLIKALEAKTVLRGKWRKGRQRCPEAILSDGGADTDDFAAAWDTNAISEAQVLHLLAATRVRHAMAAG